MPNKLILNEDVTGLGIVGDVVNVASGYARNYLVPKGLAQPFSDAAEKRLAERRALRQAELGKEIAEAENLAASLKDTTLTIAAKVIEDEKLYGSVGVTEIVAAAQKAGVVLEKEQVLLDSPIKERGEQNVAVRLHAQVTSTVTVNVIAE